MKLTDKALAVIEGYKCPYLISKRAGDEGYYLCELSKRPSGNMRFCLQAYIGSCEIWKEIQQEQADGKDS